MFSNSEGNPRIRPSKDHLTDFLNSFYPIFPVPFDVAREVNLDVTHSEGIKLVESEDECAPDVLVLPSRLKHFSKVSICVRMR